MQSQERKVVWGKTDSSEEPAQTQPPSASSTSGPWIEDGCVCLSSHNLWEQGHASPKFSCKPSPSCWPLPKIYLKLRILQVSIHLPPTALKSPFYNLLSSLKRELQIGFICKTNWLFRNSAFGTTAIPEIRSWRKDLPNKNTTCCLKVNFLVFKALLFQKFLILY